jgi:hypothetical protein
MYKEMGQRLRHTQIKKNHEIRTALRERFENINTMGITELVTKFYDVVKE